LAITLLDVAKLAILIPLALLISREFPVVGLKIYSLSTLILISPNKICTWYWDLHVLVHYGSSPLCRHFYPQWVHAHYFSLRYPVAKKLLI